MKFVVPLLALLAAPFAFAAPVAKAVGSGSIMALQEKRAEPVLDNLSTRSELPNDVVDIDSAYPFPNAWRTGN
ncbi:hypothetical protein B0O99DRAFT_626049 [Bisporella sp. PMI_857]|nr:hypothetical protein B0O99DRAFT_626049 [Bisporella sp. PMI_857]